MKETSKKDKDHKPIKISDVLGGKLGTTALGSAMPIVSDGEHPALREVAKEIAIKDIASERIQKTIESMKKTLATQDDGIGLAAPQIGIPLRIFIVSKKIFSGEIRMKAAGDANENTNKNAHEKNSEKIGALNTKLVDDAVFINPVIVKESKEKKWMEGEGCLSVRWIYGKVRRSTKVTLRAYNEKGQVVERGASGLLAHIFQHEVDHLNGVLFIDKAKDLEQVDPKEVRAAARANTKSTSTIAKVAKKKAQ